MLKNDVLSFGAWYLLSSVMEASLFFIDLTLLD